MLRRSFAVERRDGRDDAGLFIDGKQWQRIIITSITMVTITSISNQLVAQTSVVALVVVTRVQLNNNRQHGSHR